jgi:hypothetical protein
MFGSDFGEKCIIMHFLDGEKRREKAVNVEAQRRREKIEENIGHQRRPRRRAGAACGKASDEGAASSAPTLRP